MESFSQIIGWIGATLVISAYFLISSKKVQGDNRIYQLLNLLGAIGVGINASYQRAWPAFAIQIVWSTIAIVTLLKGVQQLKKKRETT